MTNNQKFCRKSPILIKNRKFCRKSSCLIEKKTNCLTFRMAKSSSVSVLTSKQSSSRFDLFVYPGRVRRFRVFNSTKIVVLSVWFERWFSKSIFSESSKWRRTIGANVWFSRGSNRHHLLTCFSFIALVVTRRLLSIVQKWLQKMSKLFSKTSNKMSKSRLKKKRSKKLKKRPKTGAKNF